MDQNSLNVAMADESVHIVGAASSESYLVIDNIVNACKQTKADAVHPGYGFLSENEAFAHALVVAGITFIGPKAEAIVGMGDKIQSKKILHRNIIRKTCFMLHSSTNFTLYGIINFGTNTCRY